MPFWKTHYFIVWNNRFNFPASSSAVGEGDFWAITSAKMDFNTTRNCASVPEENILQKNNRYVCCYTYQPWFNQNIPWRILSWKREKMFRSGKNISSWASCVLAALPNRVSDSFGKWLVSWQFSAWLGWGGPQYLKAGSINMSHARLYHTAFWACTTADCLSWQSCVKP